MLKKNNHNLNTSTREEIDKALLILDEGCEMLRTTRIKNLNIKTVLACIREMKEVLTKNGQGITIFPPPHFQNPNPKSKK
jgi:predicted Zn-ribbon and HTH transcriptional regulator